MRMLEEASSLGYLTVSFSAINVWLHDFREIYLEILRQLIEFIDNMHHILFLFSFNRELMDNENVGFKTYQALWMRIQNEVVSTRFNRFADILNLDRFAEKF